MRVATNRSNVEAVTVLLSLPHIDLRQRFCEPRGRTRTRVEVEGDVLTCPRLDIQHGELEIPPGALLSHSNHLNHSRSERRPPSDPGSSQAC